MEIILLAEESALCGQLLPISPSGWLSPTATILNGLFSDIKPIFELAKLPWSYYPEEFPQREFMSQNPLG
jgi:hypothetical protein